MWKSGIAALIVLLGLFRAEAEAAEGLDCVKAQCEGTGRTCVQTLHVTYESCRKAANKKCNGVQLAEKFNCLKAELTPCALTRNDKQAACLAQMRGCYAACGPLAGERTAYWCVGEYGNVITAAFCTADMTAERPMDQCEQAISTAGPVSMTCDPL